MTYASEPLARFMQLSMILTRTWEDSAKLAQAMEERRLEKISREAKFKERKNGAEVEFLKCYSDARKDSGVSYFQ